MYQRAFKRVMAIHDLSGLGRSSLMAAVPILSVMGIQACPVPTAVLSSQTSGFTDYSFVDLTESMPAYLRHWQEIGMDFDGIYSGFLGSTAQIELMEQILQQFKGEHTLVVIDPVMGDDGALYDTMDSQFVEKMGHLIGSGDIITPNVTELNLLTGCAADEKNTIAQLQHKMAYLYDQGSRQIIVTGVDLPDGGKCILGYTGQRGQYLQIPYHQLPASYPGTGDIFASVLTGGLLQGRSLSQAVTLAADFISHAVADAMASEEPVRDGVFLEPNLYRLVATHK